MQQIPHNVQVILKDYISLVNERFPNLLEGVYLQGSIVLDAYVEGFSDIDFVSVTSRRLLEEDAEALFGIHSRIAEKYKDIEMDGVYIVWDDLGKLTSDENIYPVYNSGEIRFESYISPITWWLLKTKGIRIIGPDRTSFTFETRTEDLISYVVNNMNSYWAQRTLSIENAISEQMILSTEDIDNEIEWSILGLLRQYYTLKEHDIISKLGAGEYGLKHVPTPWHKIIKEAINIRNSVINKQFTSDQERVNEAIEFSKYIISYCNSHFLKV
ncbi:MAG: aminoglycoside adenylyltransferase domain-containing protein [Paenisporosarcina sp.]